jgi:hypothetical protein
VVQLLGDLELPVSETGIESHFFDRNILGCLEIDRPENRTEGPRPMVDLERKRGCGWKVRAGKARIFARAVCHPLDVCLDH